MVIEGDTLTVGAKHQAYPRCLQLSLHMYKRTALGPVSFFFLNYSSRKGWTILQAKAISKHLFNMMPSSQKGWKDMFFKVRRSMNKKIPCWITCMRKLRACLNRFLKITFLFDFLRTRKSVWDFFLSIVLAKLFLKTTAERTRKWEQVLVVFHVFVF